MSKFRPGDKVRFVGDMNDWIVSHQRVLRRIGEVRHVKDYFFAGRKYSVAWIPKTKRGREEFSNHTDDELELVESQCK